MNLSVILFSVLAIFLVFIMGHSVDPVAAMPMHHHNDILPILAAGIVIKLLESPHP